MKWKVILLLLILLINIEIFSQELYCGYRVVTWEKMAGVDYTVLSSDDEQVIVCIDYTGEIIVVKF